MNKGTISRVWYGLIAIQIFVAVVVRTTLSWQDANGDFSTPLARGVNVFCYFTILSNLLVGVICVLLAKKTPPSSEGFVIAQLAGLVCIIVAGVVYHILLASEEHLTGLAVLTNFVVHTSAAIMFTIGWLFFNVHGRITWRTVRFALLFPIGWAVCAMIRGAAIHYYPYPFMDVDYLGYAHALLNMAVVTLFFLALFAGAYLIDKAMAPKVVQSR